jgi:hypothetical protein
MYKAACDACGVDMLSLHEPGAGLTVYCSPCWTGDAWDPMEYGRDYDFSKPFFVQFHELQRQVPRRSLIMTNSPGCRYCTSIRDCKNCYMVIGGLEAEDCMYGSPVLSKNCVDTDIVINADHAYETISATNAFRTSFVYFSDDCMDSSFLFDCRGLTNCFGCVNLVNRQYCLFNQQLSKGEYRKRMEYWDIGSYAKLQEARIKFEELYLATPRRFAMLTNTEDSVGDDMKNTKSCQTCFITVAGVENCKYVMGGGLLLKDSQDVTSGGGKSELLYEVVGTLAAYRNIFVNGGNGGRDVAYVEQCLGSFDLFGCVSVKNKQYVILNKQYSKDEYFALREKIIKHMSDMPYVGKDGATYRYGEYFPSELSMFPYNGSWAYEQFPLTEEAARAKGYPWYEKESTVHTPEVRLQDLPDHIKDVPDSVANKAIECAHVGKNCGQLCTSAFRIIPEELGFYRNMNLALPRLCPNCRHFERVAKRNPYKLWHRGCAKCPNEFETAISPDRKEIVYCGECYKAEFLR